MHHDDKKINMYNHKRKSCSKVLEFVEMRKVHCRDLAHEEIYDLVILNRDVKMLFRGRLKEKVQLYQGHIFSVVMAVFKKWVLCEED